MKKPEKEGSEDRRRTGRLSDSEARGWMALKRIERLTLHVFMVHVACLKIKEDEEDFGI